MSTVTVSTALDHIAQLIPTSAGGSSRLTGEGVYVLTSPGTLPERFREAQAARTAHYMTTHGDESNGRVPGGSLAGRAPRYVVTSYGVPIAWVTLDGRTHFLDDVQPFWSREVTDDPSQVRAMARHRDAIRAAWPERFVMDTMGDPVGAWPLGTAVPAGRQPSTV